MKKLCLILILASPPVFANSVESFQQWMTVNALTQFNNNYRAYLEINPRLMDGDSRLGALFVRPGIGYDVTPDLTLWVGYVLQATNTPHNNNYTLENQSYQQVTYRKTIENDKWELRSAVEERFLPGQVSYRSRYRLKYEYVFPDQKTWSIIGYDEIFFNFNDIQEYNIRAGISQNRLYAGVGFRFNPSVQIETGYINQQIWNSGLSDQDNHVLSSTLNLVF